MPAPEVGQLGERPLEELVQNASQQVTVLAREQLEAARRELTAKARRAAPGATMVGGGALLGALATGSGTSALILMLARRPGAAAALGVTGAYAGAGALLAREGLARLREAWPSVPEVPAREERADGESRKRRTKSAAKSPPRPAGRPKRESASSGTRRRTSGSQPNHKPRRTS